MSATVALAGDWPTWNYDAGRTAVTPEELPRELHLQWLLKLPAPRPAWPDNQPALQFDASYAPVMHAGKLFVPSMAADHVTAFDLAGGRKLWRFYADGPVRFAPLAFDGRVYFVSDDGFLYCLNADDGRLEWKVRGGPDGRLLLGNERLVSAWPARGAPVQWEDTIYFAAGIWPFMGTFIHAVDAKTGRVLWTNSGSGSQYLTQQHSSPAFAGVAPQGYLTATEEHLFVSGGRTVPAVYDRRTGKFLYYNVGDRTFGKGTGGFTVASAGKWFFNGGAMFDRADGAPLAQVGSVLATPTTLLQCGKTELAAAKLPPQITKALALNKRGLPYFKTTAKFDVAWKAELKEPPETLVLQAGRRVFGTRGRKIVAIDLPEREGDQAAISWTAELASPVWTLLAADGRLVAVAIDGSIHCFGSENPASEAPILTADDDGPLEAGSPTAAGDEILAQTTARAGYAVVFCGDRIVESTADLVEDLARRTAFHAIVFDRRPVHVDALRRRFEADGLLGRRVAVRRAEPALADDQSDGESDAWKETSLPPYFAELVVGPDVPMTAACLGCIRDGRIDWDGLARRLFHPLRPYGGTAVLVSSDEKHAAEQQALLSAAASRCNLHGAVVTRSGRLTLLRRDGPLPGAGQWTHQYADVGNTVVSAEERVHPPLGLLWFGGPSNQRVLPRHGHGPTPQVVAGRLFIEGPDVMRAIDVYTGRLLWERELPGLGVYYDNKAHHPGANAIGSNYISTAEGIYIANGRECVVLDPVTGRTLNTFRLPADESGESPYWGYIGVWEDLLIAGSSPANSLATNRALIKDSLYQRFAEGSRRLVGLDRHSGKLRWTRDARFEFRHNAIAAGGGKVFCIDGLTQSRLDQLKRRGETPDGSATLLALDARTGETAWEISQDVFGTWLGYSAERGVVVEGGSFFRDRAKDDVKQGMSTYRGDTGERLWRHNRQYGGPPLLHHDAIVTQSVAFDWQTGGLVQRKHPLTGEDAPWKFTRNYGCNTAVGCRSMLSFRSAAAGYFDLEGDGGTGNFGGFRAGCTSNLIPADGVLCAPDYTRDCTCAYQQQTSLALVHVPDVEMWTFNALTWNGAPVERIGINFGAPGDRRVADGSLWLEYPSVGGASPDLPITVDGKAEYYRSHASRIAAGPLPWVACSGILGAKEVRIRLTQEKDPPPRRYLVRLVFAEPDEGAAGERLLNVSLQGQQVLSGFDIANETGGANRSVVKEFADVEVASELRISLSAADGRQTILSGVEIILSRAGDEP
ncbi:MAG: PQQ-binding-like beta-propeller repeat protein [Planctomycetia bacterium]|nr:PQQ-binding-like beta-propeller repeat protein [Planctomycetia bacterium]